MNPVTLQICEALCRAKKERPDMMILRDAPQIVDPFIEKFGQDVVQAALAAGGAPCVKVSKSRLDEIFDALALVEGGNTKHLTKSAKGKIVTARKQIMEVSPDVTPEQIAKAAKDYRRRWPTWNLSSMALCAHWHELIPAEPTEAAKDDVYQEPEGDWRSVAPKVLKVSALPPDWNEWKNIPVDWRLQIKRATPPTQT